MDVARSNQPGLGEHVRFLREFVRSPQWTGAVAPSSPALAEEMVSSAGLETASHAIEVGPGTGAITGHILAKLPSEGRLMLIERNPAFIDTLRERFPRADVAHDSVENVEEVLASRQAPRADCIISGLPWAAFPSELQDRMMNAVTAALADHGCFTTFAYVHGLALPAAQSFRALLNKRFRTVERSRIVWRNLPPALVYRCRK